MTPESETKATNVESVSAQLPGATALFAHGWQYTKNHLALVGVLSVPFAVVEIFTYLDAVSAGSSNGTDGSLLGVMSVMALLGYVFLVATAVYLITHQAQTPLLADGFRWARKNMWSVLWISILTGFVVWGGFVLLIIPGIIVAVYVALSQIVLATEGNKGMPALLRSRELVYGNWRAVCWRLAGVQLVYFTVVVLAGTIAGVGFTYFANELLSEFLINLVFVLLSSVGTIITLHVTFNLYLALKTARESTPLVAPPAATKYKVFGWVGLVSLILLLILVAILSVTMASFSTTQENLMDDMMLTAELNQVQSQANKYSATQPEPSFVGVCNEVQELVSAGREVACNESAAAYAVSVQTGTSFQCVDSTGYNKVIYTKLGERTQCIDF
jgi:hypothetical protein